MRRSTVILVVIIVCSLLGSLASAQQVYRLPDLKSFKHLTTSSSDHAPDIPGKETIWIITPRQVEKCIRSIPTRGETWPLAYTPTRMRRRPAGSSWI